MSFQEIWVWLGAVFEYSMAIFTVLATVFFFLALLKKDKARRYGILAGFFAIMIFVALVTVTTGNVLWGIAAISAIGTFQFVVAVLMIITGIALIYFAYDAKNQVEHKEAYYSTLLSALIFLGLGVYLIISSTSLLFTTQLPMSWEGFVPFYSLMYPFPIARIVIVIVPLVLYAIGIYVLFERRTGTFETEKRQEDSKFGETFSTLDLEISRKIYHVVIIVVVIGYLFVGNIVLDSIYQFNLLGLPQHPSLPPTIGQDIYDNIVNAPATGLLDFRAGHLLLVMAVTWILYILIFTDFVRIKKYRYYPFKMLAKIYRDKERRVLAPHIYLTIGVLFIVILSSGIDLALNTPAAVSAQIVTMTILVSALADAVATIIGITKGKHHLKGGKSKKTWEGWISGFVSAILLGILGFMALMPLYGGNILTGIILALVAAAVFGIIDYWSPPVSDNILNPVIIGLALWGVAFLLPF